MKSLLLVLGCVFAVTAAAAYDQPATSTVAAASTISKGQMLMSANGARLGAVYRVAADGSPQIMFDGRLVTIPAATISSSDGKLVTSLSKAEVNGLH